MTANAASPVPRPARAATRDAVLLYDGRCGLCARSVQFVLRHERASQRLRFATLQGPHGSGALAMQPPLAGIDSVVWIEPSSDGSDRVLVRSDAVLAVLDHLGGGWRWLARVGRLVPRLSRDALYQVAARYRYRVFGRDGSCLLPTPDQRARFLD